ncbi:MAG: LysR family transcriptional regulator [Magnetospiraceae bacterium]
MDWDKLRIFYAVADAGSFTHAGEDLNLSQSAVSRQISNLERSLNCALFHRHARGLILTEQGDLLYRTVRDVFSKLAMVEAQLNESKERPGGPLKITTTIGFGSIWLTPRMKEFVELYPDIDASIILTDSDLDLGMREADVAIKLVPPKQPDLIRRHLMTMTFHTYASPDYLKKFGMPRRIEDLDDHQLIVYGTDEKPPVANLNWLLEVGTRPGQERRPCLKVNNIYGIYKAVQNGIGIGFMPDYLSHEAGNLVQVLPELKGPTLDVYFVYPEEQRNSMRIAVFRDYLISKISKER